jgi:hypothetical protein
MKQLWAYQILRVSAFFRHPMYMPCNTPTTLAILPLNPQPCSQGKNIGQLRVIAAIISPIIYCIHSRPTTIWVRKGVSPFRNLRNSERCFLVLRTLISENMNKNLNRWMLAFIPWLLFLKGQSTPRWNRHIKLRVRGPFAKFVDWHQCSAVMQRKAVTLMPSCSGGGNVVVPWSSSVWPSLEF